MPPGSAGTAANAAELADGSVSPAEREARCAGAAARADQPQSALHAANDPAWAPPGAVAPDQAVPCAPSAQLAAVAALRREAAAKRAAMRGAGEAAADLAAADAADAPPATAGGPRGAGSDGSALPAPAPAAPVPGASPGEPAGPDAPRPSGSARAMALRYRAGQKAAVAAVRAALGAHAGRVAAAAADAAARVWRPAEEPGGAAEGGLDVASDAAAGWGAELARMGVTCPRVREVCPSGRATARSAPLLVRALP